MARRNPLLRRLRQQIRWLRLIWTPKTEGPMR